MSDNDKEKRIVESTVGSVGDGEPGRGEVEEDGINGGGRQVEGFLAHVAVPQRD
jgi:hypothetical protein